LSYHRGFFDSCDQTMQPCNILSYRAAFAKYDECLQPAPGGRSKAKFVSLPEPDQFDTAEEDSLALRPADIPHSIFEVQSRFKRLYTGGNTYGLVRLSWYGKQGTLAGSEQCHPRTDRTEWRVSSGSMGHSFLGCVATTPLIPKLSEKSVWCHQRVQG